MTDKGGTSFNAPVAAVHSGSGDQLFFLQQIQHRSIEFHRIANEQLDRARFAFAEPPNYARLRQRLAGRQTTVVLTGRPGTGRRTAARMLLYELERYGGRYRELPNTLQETGGPLLDPKQVEDRDLLLLDLSDSNDATSGEYLRQLPSFRAVVEERRARLVVVLPDGDRHTAARELWPEGIDPGRPSGCEVVRLHLLIDDIEADESEIRASSLGRYVDTAPMRRLADLAALVRHARDAQPAASSATWLKAAEEAAAKHADEVARLVAGLPDGLERALLLAAGVLSGASIDTVHQAANEWLNLMGYPPRDINALDRVDLAPRLAAIRANVDPDARVLFESLDFDAAIRAHFWTYLPKLRDNLRDWIDRVIRLETLTPENRESLIVRFAEQCSRLNRDDDTSRLVEAWTRQPDSGPAASLLPPYAERLLEAGLADARLGGPLRRQIYRWTRERPLTQRLVQVLVPVCVGVMAVTHPEEALVRLHHLARREHTVPSSLARDALLDMVGKDRRLWRRLLWRIADGVDRNRQWVADRELFLAMVNPTRLAAGPMRAEVLHDLAVGWHAVLRDGPSAPRAAHVKAWLHAAAHHDQADWLLGVLAHAGQGDIDVYSRLFGLTWRWANIADDHKAARLRVANRLTDQIDEIRKSDTETTRPGAPAEEAVS